MDNIVLNSLAHSSDINVPDSCASTTSEILTQENEVRDIDDDVMEESLSDSMICDSGSTLVPKGFTIPSCTDEVVLFINAGSTKSMESDTRIKFLADNYYEGGDTIQTEEFITDGGEFSFIYKSARLGNFSYHIANLQPGDYFLDLHFVEIIDIFGPKGMRIFNVFVQDEKVLSEFDIFAIVGSNKPLQLVGNRVTVMDDGILVLKFEGIHGSPVVSGLCIRRAPKTSASVLNGECLICKNCSSEMVHPLAQKRDMQMKLITKYEKEIQELKDTLQRKTDECYQSWMSWKAASDQLENVRGELDNKTFRTYSLDEALEKQTSKLRDLTSKYEKAQKSWTMSIRMLEEKVEMMKLEHNVLSREAHQCVDSIPDLNKMVTAVQTLVEQCEDLKVKYYEEQVKRQKLFNEVQEAKGNIRVFCRCRPLSKTEIVARCASVVDFDAAKDGELGIINNGSTKKTFRFDRVYTPRDDQVDVFADAAPMVVSILDGYNVCIFAYGQTGTGKTFTMEGSEANRGVNYRTLEELFRISNERRDTFTYNISVSVLEVYNEQIHDLLAVETSKKLEIKQASEGFHHIPGIVDAKVESIEEVWSVLQAGSRARAVGSNNVNEHSSRSHCMLCVMVKAKNLITGECTKSKLWLVDLAGSERLTKTDAQGERLKEAQNINRSLSALGDVISALANKSSHIPYRNSKLTHLLQDSLGGNSKTLMFVQISPSDQDLSETLSSLNFATRVRGVELGPVRKQIDTSELQKTKTLLEKVRQECRSKEESVRKLEENLQSLESKARGKDQANKNQIEKIKELENQHYQSEKQVLHLSERLKEREESCSRLHQKVMDLENNKLKQQEDITTYQKKVADLENKLRQQMAHSESDLLILQQKVKELETKLKEHEENPEILSLRQKVLDLETKLKEQEESPEALSFRQKIKELEDKVAEQEKQLASTTITSEPTNQVTSTPNESKRHLKDEAANTNEAEHRILRSLNTSYRRVSHGSAPVNDKDSLPLVRRKRLSRNGEAENITGVVVQNPSSNNRSKGRPSDPTMKPAPRVPRTTATTTTQQPVVRVQKPEVRKKTTRDHPIQERDSKKRMWSR